MQPLASARAWDEADRGRNPNFGPKRLECEGDITGGQRSTITYDRPIGAHGLRWRDLQDWWAEKLALIDGDEAKRPCMPASRKACP